MDDIAPGVLARVLDGIRDVLRGVPQPRIVGTVREQSWGISFDPGAGRPLPGTVVVAESKDGRQFETRTEAGASRGRITLGAVPPYSSFTYCSKILTTRGVGLLTSSPSHARTVEEEIPRRSAS